MANEKITDKRSAQKAAFRERAVLAYAPVYPDAYDDAIKRADILTEKMYPQEKVDVVPVTEPVAA